MNRKALILGIKTYRLTNAEKSLFKKIKPWGIILFSRNIKNILQLKNLITEIKKVLNEKKYPILIDQEGGKISRLKRIIDLSVFSQDYFGTASTPLVDSGLLIINVGAPGGPCVVALDGATGREVWRAGIEWGPSYASPVPSLIHGQRRVMIFAGGESNPPIGGLMSIDPATGHVDFKFP